MSILTQNKLPLSSQRHFHTCPSLTIRTTRVHCLAATTTKLKTEPNQLVIEPRLVPPPPPKATASTPPRLNDPSLQSTWSHRAWVASGCTTVLISLAKSMVGAANLHIWAEPTLAALVGYILADLGSGVYHWGIDNYGGASTPIFGAQIEAFQGHHKWPWTITRRQFANNLHALARAITFVVLPIDLICDDPIVLGFVSTCSGCIMFSQQFHAWAHMTKSRLPPLVVALQDLGILVSRSQHAAHHRPPYNNNYCIVSGVWNEFLDNQQVFEALEMLLFFKLGVWPRSWSEPNSDWTEETEAPSQLTPNL
ncbi:B domain of TMEM189, localization domain containing protein [Parasponia andersonii]|uniref:B domain of TMEM189, localization domain containing protein n=1 Tax=Parasponia andersonii TaxID=3476 RepID=A0A2P5BRV0_PARAD|nr:B domain of TMEM189, localization domain containing protein [Parasponia andersonii]